MPERVEPARISIPERCILLMHLPVFSRLNRQECEELAGLMYEINYKPGELIVEEGALINDVFIVTKGIAEVSHSFTAKTLLKKNTKIPLATLTMGDAIGLNDTGFFSATGKRTATVTAIKEVRLLALDLLSLHQFLQTKPHIQTAMYASAEEILRIKLIKQSLPFNKLSFERLQWLANKVEKMIVPVGTEIFKQGDQGESCYLICSGHVEILDKAEDGSEHHLTVLKSPTLFGEATLITHSLRNATARALDKCELFMLRHEYLSELMENEKNVAATVMSLMVNRSRPLQNPHIIAHHRVTEDQQSIVILKNPDNGTYFKLSTEGWFIWQQLTGKKTMQDITLALTEKFNIFAPNVVAALVSKLARSGFITNVEVKKAININEQPLWYRTLTRIRRIFEARITISDTDKWLSSFYKKIGYLFFTAIGKLFLFLIVIAGMGACLYTSQWMPELFKTTKDSWLLFILLIPLSWITVCFHELGHALTTKYFGYEIHHMGFGWAWYEPIAFIDTSDMWLSTRWPRIFVNLAGVYSDLFMAGIASLLIFVFQNPYIQGFLWLFAIYTYIDAVRTLSPLQESDGYYILMDILDCPHLRQVSSVWLVKEFPRAIRHPKLFRNHFPEIVYWLTCLIFLTLITTIAYLLQIFVFEILGFESSSILVNLIIPSAIVIIVIFGIIDDVRKQTED